MNRVVDQLLKSGRVARGYLGLGMQAVRLPAALVERLTLPNEVGLMVVSAEPGGPGDQRGDSHRRRAHSRRRHSPSPTPPKLLGLLGGDQIGKTLPTKHHPRWRAEDGFHHDRRAPAASARSAEGAMITEPLGRELS